MRVLWVFGGLLTTWQQVASKLAQRGDISLEIMSPFGPEPPLDPALVPMSQLVCRNKLDFRARRILRDKLRSGAYDIVHAYTSRDLANVVAACRGLRPMPKIVGYRGTVNRLRLLDPSYWITFWHPRVAKITCVCEATRRALLASGVPEAKLATVWEGCEPKSFQTPPRSALAEFNIPRDAFVVGTVAKMRPVKGIDLLLQAAQQLHDLGNVYWLLIGDVEDPRIEKLAGDVRIRDRVRLPGARAGGGRFAGLFDVYAVPSRMEGLSLSITEAMAQQVCPLVSNVGGSSELVRDGIDGLVIPPEDSAALAGAVRLLHDDPELRQKLARSAHQRIRTQFSIAAWTERLIDVYRSLVPQLSTRAA